MQSFVHCHFGIGTRSGISHGIRNLPNIWFHDCCIIRRFSRRDIAFKIAQEFSNVLSHRTARMPAIIAPAAPAPALLVGEAPPAVLDVETAAAATDPETVVVMVVTRSRIVVPGFVVLIPVLGATVVPGTVVAYVTTPPSAVIGIALPTPAAVNGDGTTSVAVFGGAMVLYMFCCFPSGPV